MKKLFFLNIIICFNLFAQDDGFARSFEKANIAIYADSVPVGTYLGFDLDNNVESFKSEMGKVTIDGKNYDGKFYFTLKQNADLLTLKQVCKKYINEKIYTPVYLINGNFLKGDLSSVKIDNNFILHVNHINSDKFEGFNKDKSSKFTFILIFTKTEENLKRANEIRIR
jgi:hypothetical protein